MALGPGDRLGRFEIVGLVGAGGMGEVYRARDPELERDVAIKVLPADLAQEPSRLRRFEGEARSIARLDHPNLLAIHDIGRLDDVPYLVCELLEGQTLGERLDSGPLSVREALGYGVQIANGLAAAHGEGVVHRDVKPANLFVTRDGRVKILDFGLAKLLEPPAEGASEQPTLTALSGQGMMLGTLAYMAPEQAAGRTVDHRADQFALGLVLYEALSGRRPFQRDTPAETLTAILRDDPEPLGRAAPHVPAPLRWVVDRCLARDPADRYDSTRDLAKELETLADRLPELTDLGAAPGGESPETGRRLPPPITGALIALLVAAASLAAFLLGRRVTGAFHLDYQQITFRRGTVTSARFDPGGDAVLYSAAWEGQPSRIHLYRPLSLDPIVVGPAGSRLASVSPQGEILLVDERFKAGPFQTAGELARMPVTGAPRTLARSVAEAAFGPDGEVAAIVREVDGKAVLEFPPGESRLTTRGVVLDLRLSPDGERVAFAHTPHRGHDWGPIAVLDRDGGEIRLPQEAGRGLAWSPGGEEVWFVSKSGEQRRLEAVTLEGKVRLVGTFPTRIFLFDIAPDGRVLLGTEQRRYEMAGRPAGGEERDLSWLSWSVPFDVSADGETILFNECSGAGTCRVVLRDFDEQAPVVLDREGFGIRLSPDGAWVLSIPPWSPRELALIATGSEERRTFALDDFDQISLAVWSPDGEGILLSANAPGEDNRIYRLDLTDGDVVALTPEGVAFGFFEVSPDSEAVAVARTEGGIAIYPLDDGEARYLEIDEQPIRWSADGRFLYTIPLAAVPATLHRVDIASGDAELLATLLPPDPAGVQQVSPVAITPDGETYVYGYLRRISELFIVKGLK